MTGSTLPTSSSPDGSNKIRVKLNISTLLSVVCVLLWLVMLILGAYDYFANDERFCDVSGLIMLYWLGWIGTGYIKRISEVRILKKDIHRLEVERRRLTSATP